MKKFIPSLFHHERSKLHDLGVIFCSDQYLLDMNRKYLNHDYFTDIISFDLSTTDQEVAGELYISIERVRENALSASAPFSTEIRRVIFHGCLHLCGYADKTAHEKAVMRKKEDQFLAEYDDCST